MRALERSERVIADLDDTLLNEQSQISDYTLAALRRAHERGVWVVPASGRTRTSMTPFLERIGFPTPFLACNGGEVYAADGTALQRLALPVDVARRVLCFLRERGCYVQAYRDDSFYFDVASDISERYRRSSRMNAIPVGDLYEFLDFETPKLLSVVEPARLMPLYREISAAFPPEEVVFTLSSSTFLEAEPPNATKGKGLTRLAELMGFPLAQTAAFGDNLNDVSMIQAAGCGVAMENALDEVKRAARFICGRNTDDGVARFIERYVLCDGEEDAAR